MSLFSVGRVCVKIAGRDAGRKCVVVEHINDQFVLIDGDVRRRKVNVKHLEPLAQELNLSDKVSHADVVAAFKKLELPVWEKKSKKPAERPKKIRKKKEKVEEKPKKKAKKEEKKEAIEKTPAKEEKKEISKKSTPKEEKSEVK